MNSQKHSGTQEVVDMELHCVTCGTRLYIPMSQAGAVVASLERCGAAILVTRLRIWGRSSESFAREWDRGGRARLVTRAFDTWPGACRLLA